MALTLEQAIDNIWHNKTEDQFFEVTLTLLKLIQNVLYNPDKPKFKKIKRNAAFFFNNPGVENFLSLCGFEVRDNWMVFLDTEVAFLNIDTGKRCLLSYRKKFNSLKAFEVPENSLKYSAIMLGKGKFASVYQGTWENCSVAIKALHPYCAEQAVLEFQREAEILRNLKHNNIIILYAVCLQNVNKRSVHVLELMDRTILDVLRTDPDISTEKLVGKALEVAAGLDHIHSKGILHCDIAARNILLNVQGVVKISDFGLARYADSPDCNLAGKTTVFPIRWTAPEVFTENILTKASDVWSYGVLCYEFITRGKTPYGTFQNRQIKKSVSNGYRLPKSEECPDDLYHLMLKCWNAESLKRPSFQNIYQDLINMKLGFAKKQRFAVCFDSKDDKSDISPDRQPVVSAFRRQSLGMRASIRKVIKSVSGKRPGPGWGNEVGEDSLSITTTLLDCPKDKITIHCKKDARTSEIIRKAVLKIGWNEKDAYKFALVEVYDPRFGMRRSQPALNTAVEHSLPYVKLRGIMEQPVLIKAGWIRKDQTRYLLCPRGVILRVLELNKMVHEGLSLGPLSHETKGYLLQSTGLAAGRLSLMWSKVWGTLDGTSLGLFEDEDCEETWDEEHVVTVQHACISEARCDMFTVTDLHNIEHTFQADDKDDATRWVEAINAAQHSHAPPSTRLALTSSLHTGKLLVITGIEGDDCTVNYGHKHVTLRRDELFFLHNGERISASMVDWTGVDIIKHCQNNTSSTPNGIKIVFNHTKRFNLYPSSQEDFFAWASALHKAAIQLNKTDVIRNSSLNVLKNGDSETRSGSPDSGILSSDSVKVSSVATTVATPSPEIEDSFSELNRSIRIEEISANNDQFPPHRLGRSCSSPPPLPPRNKPFMRSASSPPNRPLPAIPSQAN